jgi:predicted acetylornithine/succinylornithine family transaminase
VSTDAILEQGQAHLFQNHDRPAAVMVRGEGPWLWDNEDRRYLDLSGGLSVTALGHAHPALARAIASQAARLGHVSNLFYNDKASLLAAALCARSFGERVFFANSGAEANEAAIKLARRYFYARGAQRFEIVAATNSFHGRTLGALAATGQPRYHEGFAPLPAGFRHVPYGDADALIAAITPQTALVMLEPMQGEGGVIVPPPGYLAAVRRACDDAGVLLHFDEVQVGMGRTGRLFCHEHDGVIPDTMSLAKALGGGLPIGALVAKEGVAAVLTPGTHASTFGGNPIACAAGLATIEVLEREGLVARSAAIGARILETLRAAELPHVTDVRGRGCLIGIEMDAPALPWLEAMRQKSVLASVIAGRVIRLAPAFNIPWEVLDEGLATVIAVIRARA